MLILEYLTIYVCIFFLVYTNDHMQRLLFCNLMFLSVFFFSPYIVEILTQKVQM